MLALRPCCEYCGKDLPPHSTEAMICSFECTFCHDCATQVLQNVCPNCGGGLERRPVRPSAKLEKYPASVNRLVQKPDPIAYSQLQAEMKDIPPHLR